MYANRSGKITVELHENLTATGYIDGKKVYKGSIFRKVSVKTLNRGKWDTEAEVFPVETKDDLWDLKSSRKVKFMNNPSKEFYKKHAVTPSQFCKVFNAAVFKSAIAPYMEFASLYFQRKSNIPGKFASVVKNHDLLVQAVKDGQKNILPLLNKYGKTPQELKKEMGKGLWKRLCANTLHRNKLIILSPRPVCEAINLDSGALEFENGAEAAHWVRNTCKIPYSKKDSRDWKDSQTLFTDTKFMALQNDQPFNPEWSKLKMQEKHNEYMGIVHRAQEARRKEQDEAYRLKMEKIEKIDLSKVYPQTEFELNGAKAKILTTYEQIKQEGVVQNHCVGIYAESATVGQYAVVHISGDDEETTLGLSTSVGAAGKIVFSIQQHYGKYNSGVSSQGHKEIAEIVVEYLNSLNLERNHFEKL